MNLDAVRDALMADADGDGLAEIAEADRWAAHHLAEARAEAGAAVATARAEGEAEVAAELAGQRAEARRDARRRVLEARSEARTRLLEAAASRALALRDRPGYERFVDALALLARSQLGEGADIERDPSGRGGVIATAGGRRVDYTLRALVERGVERLGPEVDSLWR
ncbi:MAG: hypothetical protein IPM45_15855 [Acidimicrobiales bacterium]|nr:hypothetical protein [Acidimicrobiales bacterium]